MSCIILFWKITSQCNSFLIFKIRIVSEYTSSSVRIFNRILYNRTVSSLSFLSHSIVDEKKGKVSNLSAQEEFEIFYLSLSLFFYYQQDN